MAISFTVPDEQEHQARWLLNEALTYSRENWRGYTFFDSPAGDERRAEQVKNLALIDVLIEQNIEVLYGFEFGWVEENNPDAHSV